MTPPSLAQYLAAIDQGFAEMMVHEKTRLWCEPGRALVAEGSSLLTRVELRKGDALYLNDGAYGSLFDAAHSSWPYPAKLVRQDPDAGPALRPYRFYGPTCDSADHMRGPFWLPEDVREGDYVEIGMIGAYGVAMSTRFNGFGEIETVRSLDPPMASMFGLAPTPAATASRGETETLVKLRGARARRRRRR
jgi:ornithine decarboxylase